MQGTGVDAESGSGRVTATTEQWPQTHREPCPDGPGSPGPTEGGMNPNPCSLWGCWRWAFRGEAPLQAVLARGSRAGKGGSDGCGQGAAVLGLCKEKGPLSLPARLPQGSQQLLLLSLEHLLLGQHCLGQELHYAAGPCAGA